MLKRLLRALGKKRKKEPEKIITREEIDKRRVEAFERWVWKTGSEEDREIFETCDLTLEILKEQEEAVKEMLENLDS